MTLLECHPCGPGNWPINSGHRTVNPRRPGHRGSDVNARRDPLYASISGKAYRFNQPGGAGYYVQIVHYTGFFIYYFHMSRVDIVNGQDIQAGEKIGISGGYPGEPGAGNTDGPHLHFEIWQYGVDLNPEPYMAEVMHNPLPGGGGSSGGTPPTGEQGDYFDMGTMSKEELKNLMIEVEKETSGVWEQDTRKYMGHTVCEFAGNLYYIDTYSDGTPAKFHIPDPDMFWTLIHARFLSSGPSFVPGSNAGQSEAERQAEINSFAKIPVRAWT